MARFVVRRLMLIPPVLLLANFTGYAYARLAQRVQLMRNPFIALESTDLPLFEDYGGYLLRVLRFDWGNMPGTDAGVWKTVWELGGATVGLLLVTFTVSVLIGFALGLRATRSEPPSVAAWLTGITTLGQAMPSFFTGSLFIAATIFYAISRQDVAGPPLPFQGFGWDEHLVLPVLALMFRPTVQIAQFTANMLSSELGKQYVVTARSSGHTWRDVRWRLAMRNILAGVVLNIAAAARFLVVEVVVIEWLFYWPGVGRLFAQTLVPSDVISTTGQLIGESIFLNANLLGILLMGLVGTFMLTDLVASTAAQHIDPRLRMAEEAANG